ncbi:hypothetical protein VPH5P1C_0157 [Vibrio phage 5P1c]
MNNPIPKLKTPSETITKSIYVVKSESRNTFSVLND